jgi:hypothetical protein
MFISVSEPPPDQPLLYGFVRLKSRKKPVKISALAYFATFCYYLSTLSDSFGFCRCKYSGYKMCLSFRRPRLLDASLRHCQARNLFLQALRGPTYRDVAILFYQSSTCGQQSRTIAHLW